MLNNRLTDICRIGVENLKSDELELVRRFYLNNPPKFATIKMQSEGVFGIFVNRDFVEAHKGLLVNRVFYMDITPFLKQGENEIKFVAGFHYFQSTAEDIKKNAGYNFTFVAAEINVESCLGETTVIRTDTKWDCLTSDINAKVSSFGEITRCEYDRFWLHAALWRSRTKPSVNQKIVETVGDEYLNYLNSPMPAYVEPKKVLSSNYLTCKDEFTDIADVVADDENYILYDFERIVVGYTVIEYKATNDTCVEMLYDYTENPSDFIGSEIQFVNNCMNRLKLKIELKKNETKKLVIHRRAARYIFVKFPKSEDLDIVGVKIKSSMFPALDRGWFKSKDELLNKIWSVGKYTLQINRHQEYESCPRHEMKFFSGDGIMEALVDYYVSGGSELTDATLSIVEPTECSGKVLNKLCRNIALWDYPAWRIIMLYNYFCYFGLSETVKLYYEEAVNNLEWMLERLGKDNLVYQHVVYADPFFSTLNSIEYTGSEYRLGRKAYLNVLFYKSFSCMADIAKSLEDERSHEWEKIAGAIKEAINKHLWSETQNAYIDESQGHYIPQEGNALAVLFGVAEGDRTKRVLKSLKENNWTGYGSTILSEKTSHTRNGNEMISPMMCAYEAESRFLNNDGASAVDLVKRCWGSMVLKGAESYWEFAPNNDTRWIIPAHGWSSACTYLIGAYVIGIKPIEEGYKKLSFSPLADIGEFEGVVPTPKGDVAVKCNTHDNKKSYVLVVPKDVEVVVSLTDNDDVEIVKY